MRRALGLWVLVLSGCPAGGLPANSPQDSGTELLGNTCAADSQCPAGMVCEGCGGGGGGEGEGKTCVPGCREKAQCPATMTCNPNVLCTECPCPPGWCDLDPCRDVDGDGFAPVTEGPLQCPGKKTGDCDDARKTAFPGAVEVCANGVDDDCDGKSDARDDDGVCRTCGPSQSYCSTSRNCGLGARCERGCCETCGTPPAPTCDAGQCVLPGGLEPDTGCQVAPVCADCSGCPTTVAYVCGLNGVTYQNACLARAAGTQALYAGQCLTGEQYRCTGQFDCFGNQYCRDTSPDAGVDLRCTRLNTCVHDVDCELAVRGTVLCPDGGGVAPLGCDNFRCVTRCQ